MIDALDEALGALLLARIEAFPIVTREVPVMALDAALSTSGAYQNAKASSAEALRAVLDILPEEHRHLALRLDSVVREEGGVVADVAFSIGLTATGSR